MNARLDRSVAGRSLWLAVSLLFAGAATANGQVFQGQLVDEATEDPVADAVVAMIATDSTSVDAVATDSAGAFELVSSEPGEFRLLARRIGYPATISAPLRLRTGDTLRVEFRISAGAVLLDPVVVTGRRRPPPPDIVAFYDRAERSINGTFITRQEIEDSHVMRASDLLRRIPGVQLGPMRYGSSAVQIRGCTPMIIVDGVHARFENSIDNLVTPMELEGLEVYRSAAQVPVQYGGLRSTCGAILIWTRRGP